MDIGATHREARRKIFPRTGPDTSSYPGGMCSLCALTFELSGQQRQDARARAEKMYTVPRTGPWWPAVGAPLERRVRPHAVCQA